MWRHRRRRRTQLITRISHTRIHIYWKHIYISHMHNLDNKAARHTHIWFSVTYRFRQWLSFTTRCVLKVVLYNVSGIIYAVQRARARDVTQLWWWVFWLNIHAHMNASAFARWVCIVYVCSLYFNWIELISNRGVIRANCLSGADFVSIGAPRTRKPNRITNDQNNLVGGADAMLCGWNSQRFAADAKHTCIVIYEQTARKATRRAVHTRERRGGRG